MSPLMGDKMKRNAIRFLFLQTLLDGISHRTPMQVIDVWSYRDGLLGRVDYPLCPRCRGHIEHEHQGYCNHCGQALEWSLFDEMHLNELT